MSIKSNIVACLCALIFSSVLMGQNRIDLPYVETNSHVQSIIIKSIELSEDYTIVNMRFVNTPGSGWVNTPRPGSSDAFYIADIYGNRIAELVNVKNLPYKPQKRRLYSYNDVVEFTLIFEPINSRVDKIDIIEGNASSSSRWNFYGVQLPKTTPVSMDRRISKNEPILSSTGTGFMISTEGYVATNYHVISDASRIELVFPIDGQHITYRAEISLLDKANDLALLKITDSKFSKLDNLPFEISDDYDVGEQVFTIGYPQPDIMGSESKLTTGIINSLSGIENNQAHLQISVQIQPGNSGGPLFNSKGDVVGVTTSTLNSLYMAANKGNIPQNVNYAVKSEYLNLFTRSIKKDGANKVENLSLREKNSVSKRYVCLIKVYE